MFSRQTAAAAILAFFTAAASADTCWVAGITYSQDRPVSGGSGLSELLMYQGQLDSDHIIASYSGDYDPNCCIGENRETDFTSPLPYVFEYTAMMQSSGLELSGCSGNYADQTGIPGAVSTSENVDWGSSVSSSCVITFNC